MSLPIGSRSRYPVEPKPDKYVIPFAPELIPLILSGEKVMTYRFGDKYDYLQVGDQVNIQDNGTKEIVAPAEVTDKEKTTFGKLPLNRAGHEPFNTKEEQREVFNGYYAYIMRKIIDEDRFLILGFRLKEAR